MKPLCLIVLAAAACFASNAGAKRPNRGMTAADLPLACEGDHDQEPVLIKGKTPVVPIKMLNPDLLEDRWIRGLPLHWDVATEFAVTAEGRTATIRSTTSDPPSFSRHMNAAVTDWRFTPAMAQGKPVAVRCRTEMRFEIHR